MPLVLKVTSVNNQTLQTQMECEFDEIGGTIGRKVSNTWVLPDEQRHLSGSHASVEYSEGIYYLVDTSTNGVFINGNDKPLGKENKQQLEDGFQLLMGTFNIEVSILNEATSSNGLPNDIFTETETKTKTGTDITDDLFSDLFDDSKEVIDSNLFEPLNPIDVKPSKNIGSDDPFFDFDEFNASSESQKPKKESILGNNESEMDSSFKPSKVSQFSQESAFEKSQSNTSADKNISFLEADNEQNGIPDDWSLTSTTEKTVDDFLTGFTDSLQSDEEKDIPFVDHHAEIPKDALSNDIFKSDTLNTEEVSLSNNAFLKGLGLDESSFKNGLSEQQLFIAGKLFRSAIQGTVDVLQSRAEIKNEMRMDMTTIQPIQNNPIKFAIDTDEAIRKLLTQDNKSYMDPQQAMNEVYDDITSHQLAIISGIQASLSHVLKRFEPKNLITRFEKDSPISASIPVHRKAKLWESFEKLYGIIETEAEDDFNRLFGQEFSKAYDQQVETLKKKRSK